MATSASPQPSYEELVAENARLRQEVEALRQGHNDCAGGGGHAGPVEPAAVPDPLPPVERLTAAHIARYSRQLLVSDFGVDAQRKLLSSSVLVVGAGGLGSSALLYLAAAGVGRLGVVDMDTVDASNLHRQVIHTEARQGLNKAESARAAVRALNSRASVVVHACRFGPSNGVALVEGYDAVVDASDNPRTRYLISDACVLAGRKPLISGAALGTEGTATVYVHNGAPCYRCLHPRPLAAEASRSCSDNGVLGPVPGLIGVIQAMEAIKVLTGVGQALTGRMLLYDSLSCTFRAMKLPARSGDCAACGHSPAVTTLADSEAFADAHGLRGGEGAACAPPPLPDIPPEHQVDCQAYHHIRASGQPHTLLDVREPAQFKICHLGGAVSLPLKRLKEAIAKGEGHEGLPRDTPVYVMCRRGVLSAHATRLLLDNGYNNVFNVQGGLTRWHADVEPAFPMY